MRNLSAKALCLIITAQIVASPWVIMADDFCQCADCARLNCMLRLQACSSHVRAEGIGDCCRDDEPVSKASDEQDSQAEDFNTAGPAHRSEAETKNCRCSTYLRYDGNALSPAVSPGLSSTVGQFCQHAPRAFAASGWVCQTFHPPR